jgi:hypothetical protein
VSNRLYRFNNKKTWNDVFDEVTDPEEVDLKKTYQILVTVSDRAGQTFEPNMEESARRVLSHYMLLLVSLLVSGLVHLPL